MATLQLLGSYNIQLVAKYPAVKRGFSAGHNGDDLPTAEIRVWKLSFKTLPDAVAQSVTDPEISQTLSQALYFWRFVNRRIQDGAAFQVKEPEDQATVTVKVAQDHIAMRMNYQKLYESELVIEEYIA